MNFLEKLKFEFSPVSEKELEKLKKEYTLGYRRWCQANDIDEDCEDYESIQKILMNSDEIMDDDYRIFTEQTDPWIHSQIEFTQVCQALTKQYLAGWKRKEHREFLQLQTFKGRSYRFHEYNRGLEHASISQQDIDDIMTFLNSLREQYGTCLVLLDESENSWKELEALTDALEQNSFFYGTQLSNPNALELYHHIVIIRLGSDSHGVERAATRVMHAAREQEPEVMCLTFNRNLEEEVKEKASAADQAPHQEEEESPAGTEEAVPSVTDGSELIRELDTYFEGKRILEKITDRWQSPARSRLGCFSMFNYYPTTCDWEPDDRMKATRRLIWDFKASKGKDIGALRKRHGIAARTVCSDMVKCMKHFFGEETRRLTLVCIPASSQQTSELRYSDFAEMVCGELGMQNGFPHVKVVRSGSAKHLGGSEAAMLTIDEKFFKNKNVLLFDDIITSGNSMEAMRRRLESMGATVIGGFSIGQTRHEQETYEPIDKI